MSSKRRTSGAGSSPNERYTLLMKKLYQVRVDGRALIELFTEIPDIQMYPDYRDVVDVPISLAEIGKRVRIGAYDTDESVIADFELMADNAKAYNGDDSPVYDDAVDILDFVLLYLGQSLSRTTRGRLQFQILNELEGYKYKGRRFSDAFMTEPDPKVYPSYYDVVKEATSFTKVRKQVERHPVETWDEFQQQVGLIFSNAMLYNQEGSQIYNDARSLRKQLDTKIKKYSQLPKHLAMALPKSASSSRLGTDDESNDNDEEDEEEDERMSADDDEEEEDEEEALPEVPRFDDDDDEDFEADFDDFDEEDLPENDQEDDGNAQNNIGQDEMGPQFMQPQTVYDEITTRPPGQTPDSALLRMVTCQSTPIPPQMAVNLPIEDVKRAENDMLQLRIPPSPTLAFTTYATTLPYYQSTLRLSVLVNKEIHPLQLTVLLNGGKIMPLPTASPQQQWENFDISLAPGLNQVTVIAIKAAYGGFIRHYGPPPLADAEPDEERMVLFLNLSK